MSAHYLLQTCPSHAGVATQQGTIWTPKKVAEILGSQVQPGAALSAVPQAHVSDTTLTKGMARSYSAVVASCPSSPVSSTKGEATSGEAEILACSARVEETLVNLTEVVSNNNTENIVQTITVDSLVTHGSHTPYSLKFNTFLSPPSWFTGKSAP